MAYNVFISKGSTTTLEQREFVDALLEILKTVGLSPRIMNENEWSHEQPLKAIKKIISNCDGVVIIAFTRTFLQKGKEIKKSGEAELENIGFPTPWNHIEGSIGYTFGVPLLVIAENGIRSEGLIEKGYDWSIYWADFNANAVKEDRFRGFLFTWKEAVAEYAAQRSKKKELAIDPEKITMGTLLKVLTVAQLWKIIASVITLLSAVATIAYRVGAGKWPWNN